MDTLKKMRLSTINKEAATSRKVADLRNANLLKKRLAQVFSSEFCEISKNTIFTEHLWTAASINRDDIRQVQQIKSAY